MQLIDADKMAVEESEAYISAQCQTKDDLTRSVNAVVHTKIQRLIADTPTVDAVEVVRCKDCKHAYINKYSAESGVALCRLLTKRIGSFNFITEHDDFCSFGERRTEENGDS